MKYKAIGFDYGVVINGLPGILFNRQFCELVGITDDQYRDTYFTHNKKVNRGEITWEELWHLVLADLHKPEKLKDVMALQDEFFKADINMPILELIDELRLQGYKTGLLSNNTSETAAEMRRQGIDMHFDVFHVSGETGLVKPEPEAFLHLAEALDVDIKELIFIDDANKSLETAEQCGFTPILFESYEQLHEQLTQMNVLK